MYNIFQLEKLKKIQIDSIEEKRKFNGRNSNLRNHLFKAYHWSSNWSFF